MLNLKPFDRRRKLHLYIRDTVAEIHKFCEHEVTVITRSPHDLKMNERHVPISQIMFVLHFQLYKRDHEMLFIEGFCVNRWITPIEECKKILKEYLESKNENSNAL